jgi:hypothetical protein
MYNNLILGVHMMSIWFWPLKPAVTEGADVPVSQVEMTQAREVESVMVSAFVQEDAEGLIRKVALLEGELAAARRAR